jgi:MFS transporter, UMF1 family
MNILKDIKNKREITSWMFYDWANSAFATVMMAAILPVYYSNVAAESLSAITASSYWGYTNTIAMIVIAFLAPILGAISDMKNKKLSFLKFFLFLGVVSSGLLFYIKGGHWMYASLLYIIGRIGFSGGNLFYDSFLPHITTDKNVDRVSTLGYAFGYLGGGLLLAINLSMILSPEIYGFEDSQFATRFSFVTVAVWWAVFSIPIFKNVSEPKINITVADNRNTLLVGFRKVISTLKEIRKFRQVFMFLLAFWLYNDGIGTIMVMAVIFGTEIGIGMNHLVGAILTVQFLGIPFTILFGKLAKKITAKRAIYLGLIVYTLIAIGGYFMTSALHFWLLAIGVGMVQGGTQALSRSLFSLMTPKSKSAEFFGFFDISQKFSGIIGPAIFGLIGQLAGSSRPSIFALIIFFIGGMYLLEKVRLPEGIAAAKAANG